MARKLVSSIGNPGHQSAGVGDELNKLACTNKALRRAARRLGQLYDGTLAPIGLKGTQVELLSEIHQFAGPDAREGPTLQFLAGRLAIQISALTHALRPLVRDGLVEVRQDKDDKRIKHGVLTPSGKTRLQEALILWAVANQRVEAVMGTAAVEKLRGLADEVASEEFFAAYHAGEGKAASPSGSSRN